MWPYNDDEAVWLTPPDRGQARLGSANDNDPERRLPPRGAPAPSPKLPPKSRV